MLEEFDPDRFAELVHRNVEIKAAVVAQDEHDVSGERAILNFGHTVGHAVERATAYNRFLHGEAVSLGITAACEISVRRTGFPAAERDKIVQALSAFDLPTRLPKDVDRAAIVDAVAGDKKFERGQVRFVVVDSIGSARLTTDVTMEDIASAIETL
jgi:3-dehydroquinate synthetase